MLQIDYSENAEIIHQDEVQSAHWSYGQCIVFTAVAWTSLGTYSYGILSDCTEHTKYSSATMIKVILDDLNSKHKNKFSKLQIWSDGAAQHFKQRFMFGLLTTLKKEFQSISWEFFAASHGKGAVDGIGGTIKRKVFMAIKSRARVVRTPQEYFY